MKAQIPIVFTKILRTVIAILLVPRLGCCGNKTGLILRRYGHGEELKRDLELKQGVNLTMAIRDIVRGLPASHVSLLFDTFLDIHFPEHLTKALHEAGITTSIHIIDNEKSQEEFCQYTKEAMKQYEDAVNIIFSSKNTASDLLWTIQQQDLIHRKLLHIVYWGRENVRVDFTNDYVEAMRIAIISNPRPGTYRIYYSQADSLGDGRLTLVNWWSRESGLFRNPVLPKAAKVYENFRRRIFYLPVLHKPPWHFVLYNNDSYIIDGGRDDKLIDVIAGKLNFRYKYIDPPERIQGSSFPGALGMIWSRELDFFIGDVTITLERSLAVEFSFLTLVDSEVFVTHRPSKLNEALALVRPFHWQVWPPIVSLIILYGPVLFAIIEAPTLWRGRRRTICERLRLLNDCVWFSTATFLRQGGKQPGRSHKVRLVLILMTLGSTYVIGDMYSANLTSLLARPGREKPITTLEQLERAMEQRAYQLLVEKHSSSYTTLQNGTGIYERLWKKMKRQRQSVIESIEAGMKMVRAQMNVAVLGGRETLYFDTKRFGSYNFHLSEKLNTRYSAIAMQNGCPYIENFNNILMQLFEGGILSKMTEEEYEILGEKLRAAAGKGSTDEEISQAKKETETTGELSDPQGGSENVQEGDMKPQASSDSEHQLQPLSTRMLQGAFYMLFIGYFLSSIVLAFEMNVKTLQHRCKIVGRIRATRAARKHRRKCATIRRKFKDLEMAIQQPLHQLLMEYEATWRSDAQRHNSVVATEEPPQFGYIP